MNMYAFLGPGEHSPIYISEQFVGMCTVRWRWSFIRLTPVTTRENLPGDVETWNQIGVFLTGGRFSNTPGVCLTKACDVTIKIYRQLNAKTKSVKYIFWGVWIQTFCKISKVPFEILHHILNPYTAKICFSRGVKFDEFRCLNVIRYLKI